MKKTMHRAEMRRSSAEQRDAKACQAVVGAELQLKPVNRLAFSSWRVSATA
jgi:hypothetical protein